MPERTMHASNTRSTEFISTRGEEVMFETDSVVVVSVDTHVGPRLTEDLRTYCPVALLDEFDEYARAAAQFKQTVAGVAQFLFDHPNFQAMGHYDSSARLADYDYDGVAAGVIFHASENFEPMPFGSLFPGDEPADKSLVAAGLEMYNNWLADFCSQAPLRHIGMAYLPMWDIDSAVQQLGRVHEMGLRGVNFPALKAGNDIIEYNSGQWDPFWAKCEALDIPLVTHVGTADNLNYGGAESYALKMIETGAFFSHRAVWWLIYGGVFERFPRLKLVITETPGDWFPSLADELDAAWHMFSSEAEMNADFYKKVPRKPSDYMNGNVFLGASFASPFEVRQAVEHGFSSQVMWGSDYPHVEGTYVHPLGGDRPSVTEIAAPSLLELKTPIDAVPEGASIHAFRSGKTGWS
jgi:predicted TIM-barrel fold metal-dependent hydrolase